ncbi:hypothetical protein DPSP01_001053 [Paraphaeosphaeria sporulosa]
MHIQFLVIGLAALFSIAQAGCFCYQDTAMTIPMVRYSENSCPDFDIGTRNGDAAGCFNFNGSTAGNFNTCCVYSGYRVPDPSCDG